MDLDRAGPGAAMLRTPRAAGVAGVAFSLLLGLVILLFKLSVPSDGAASGAWLTDPDRRRTLTTALTLVPFAGIAFLWFMGVVRDRIGDREDRFFATVFLGSGLLFVAMLFAGAAVNGAVVESYRGTAQNAVGGDLLVTERHIAQQLLNVYALRMAAVFVLSTTSIGYRTGVLPRWLGIFGLIVAATLLVSAASFPWVNLAFPLWTLVLSIHILRVAPHGATPRDRPN
jgi:hypothetical protein